MSVFFKAESDVEKGNYADAMKHITADMSEILVPFIDDLIEFINYKTPIVKWGIPESIGNIAQKFPDKTEKVIPKLLINTKEDSTVVKWCAAYGLTEIIKHNLKTRKKLLPIFSKIVKTEKNNGVKNIYLRALKILEK